MCMAECNRSVLRPYVMLARDRRPLLALLVEDRGKFGRARAARNDPKVGEARGQSGLAEDRAHFGSDALAYVIRHVFGTEETEQAAESESRLSGLPEAG